MTAFLAQNSKYSKHSTNQKMPRIIGRKFCAISVLICLVLQCASPASSAGNATEPSTTSTTDSPIYAISSVPVNGPKSAIAVLSDYVQDM